jgi:broad specificity phosphatase PhoE
LRVPFKTAPDLHEHVRGLLPEMSDEAFRVQIAELFARPDELVFGQETATQALVRFTVAVQQVLGEHPANATIGLVTHGTVMSLYVATLERVSPFAFWQQLGLPAFVVIDRAEQVVEETHFKVVE